MKPTSWIARSLARFGWGVHADSCFIRRYIRQDAPEQEPVLPARSSDEADAQDQTWTTDQRRCPALTRIPAKPEIDPVTGYDRRTTIGTASGS